MKEMKPLYLESPPEGIVVKVTAVLESAGIKPNIAASKDDAFVVVSWPGAKVECTGNDLFSGGYMTCPNAFRTAAGLGMELGAFGELLNVLDIKLRQCQLGCF